VGVLGATGMVGARLVELLARHPWFEPVEVAASDRSAGERLVDRLTVDAPELPDAVANLRLAGLDGPFTAPLLLSALPADVARVVEPRLAREGRLVVSNASASRMDPTVPLVVPEVNPDHLALLDEQKRRWPGGIVTNPNCSVAGLVVALKPLHDAFGLREVVVTTLQAISGAGRPGPSALDMVDNVVPFIGGEEDKMAAEPRRILGVLAGGTVTEADFALSATCTRVPVLHGHLEAVSIRLARPAGPDEAIEALRAWRGAAEAASLPTSPERALEVLDGADRPQPRADRERGGGMTVTVGRVRACAVHGLKLVVLSHNLLRGAAGAAVVNAELACVQGRIPGVTGPPTRP
jgi:aspartate-semialdehyde dehydrogenase